MLRLSFYQRIECIVLCDIPVNYCHFFLKAFDGKPRGPFTTPILDTAPEPDLLEVSDEVPHIKKYSIFSQEDRERIFCGIKQSRDDSYFPQNPFAFELEQQLKGELGSFSRKLRVDMNEHDRKINDMASDLSQVKYDVRETQAMILRQVDDLRETREMIRDLRKNQEMFVKYVKRIIED